MDLLITEEYSELLGTSHKKNPGVPWEVLGFCRAVWKSLTYSNLYNKKVFKAN
jgi:hypothetical protein